MYDFSTLSPADFELLTRDLLRAEHGWALKAFATGPDGGVDLSAGSRARKVIVQCKHYARSSAAQLVAAVRAEQPKIQKLKPGRYLLVTSRDLTRKQADAVLAAVPSMRPEDLLHRSDLNALLGKHPEVERQHFKLWLASANVLSQIVHSGIWARSEALMEDIQSRVRLYVAHPGFARAEKVLSGKHVVVISGSPGVGKSMLAEMLMLNHWHSGWQVVQVGASIEEANKVWAARGKQIFFYDDFLGQTSSGESESRNEDALLAQFAHRVSRRPDKRLVLTTRTQVFKQAVEKREPLARAQVDLRDCRITLKDYSLASRARILYNHLYFSALPRRVVREYAAGSHVWTVIAHPNFTPRIVEQILRRDYTSATALARDLGDALDRPIDLWGTTFQHQLSPLARELLQTLVTFPPDGVLLTRLLAACPLKASQPETHQTLKTLEATWLTLIGSGSKATARFADPSCRDYVLAYLDEYEQEAARVLSEAGSLDQLVLLLRYAHRRQPAGLRAAVDAAGDLTTRVRAAYEQALRPPDAYPLKLLSEIATVVEPLGDDGRRWLADAASDAVDDGYASSASTADLDRLLGALLDAWPEPDGAQQSVINDLIRAMAGQLQTEDDVTTVQSLLSNAEWLIDDSTREAVRSGVADYVSSELDELDNIWDDPADMRNYADDLSTLARRHDVYDRLEKAFNAAHGMIDAKPEYTPPRADEPSSSSDLLRRPGRKGTGGDGGLADAERRQIQALFTQLT